MIVENDAEMSRLLELIFLEEGLRVVTASNGQEALDLLDSSPIPQLIFSDVTMPIMGGLELTSKLKSDAKTKDIPVILASGLNDFESTSHESGATAFLKKPYNIEAVIDLVKSHLN